MASETSTAGRDPVRWDPADTAALRGCAAVWGAAQDIDDPDGPRMTGQVLSGWLQQSFTGDAAQTWYLPGSAPGSVIGWYRLALPDLENRDRADLLIVIDPAARHRARAAAARGRAGGGERAHALQRLDDRRRRRRRVRAGGRGAAGP